jgi:hypothetical protein
MSKGGGSTRTITQSSGPPAYAKPFLEYGMSQAKEMYEGGPPQYYPGQTVVGYSPESEMALAGQRQMATSGSPFIPMTQAAVMQNLMGTNPLQSAAFKPVVDQVASQFASAGRYGSGAQQGAVASALAPMAYQAQQAAIQQAPAAYEFGFSDLQKLAEVGAAREAQSQAELEADMQRFQFEQESPLNALANYMSIIQGGTVGGDKSQPVFRQPVGSALSGALGGAQMVGSFAPGYAGLGAAAGGLAGLLGA